MKGKLLFLIGLGVGYVFGTRAGRQRYEQLKSAAQNLWESEPVQWSVRQAQDAVGDVAEEAITATKRLIHQVTGEKKPAARKPATQQAKKPATTSAHRKTPAKPASEKQ